MKLISYTFLCILSLVLYSCIEKEQRITIFMIGDSTMADKEIKNGNQERGWGQMLPDFLTEDIVVKNHAADGRSSLSFINEGRWDKVLSELRKGDYVFIQFGHNDEKPAEELHTVPGQSFDNNLRRFVREARAKGANPVLLNSIVRRNYPPPGCTEHQYTYETEGEVLVDTHGAYAESPRRIAKEMDVPFMDMTRLTHDLVAGMGPEESKKLFMWIPPGVYDFCPDGKVDNTHLNIYGGKVIAELAIREVAKVVPAITPFIRHHEPERLVHNGIPWFDDQGNIVNAHGACIVKEEGRYYLFGEWKSDESNAFPGFSCYSSDDLVSWKFENVVLPMQKDGILGPNRVGERVKVMKCPSTGEFVMYMHADDMGYYDPHIGYATCKTIAGDYEFHGPLMFEGEPIRRWDMGTYQDTDGKGYLLIHHGIIYRLSDDYHSAEAKILDGLEGSGESPAMFRKNGLYYMLYSGLTSWEKNDNFYFTAPRIEGPWTAQGLFAPEGALTYNSQTTFVFPLVFDGDTIPMFMGDRWSYPHQASAATYVWMPMQVDGEKLSIPEYWECWNIEKMEPTDPLAGGRRVDNQEMKFVIPDNWQSDNNQIASNIKGNFIEIPFKGTRITVKGETNNKSGYARISIRDEKNEILYTSLVDFYSKSMTAETRYISPVLPSGQYTLTIEVTGISPVWTDKTKTIFGSTDCYVTLNEIVYFD